MEGHRGRGARPLAAAFALTAVVFAAELAGGLWTGSLALVADSVHMAVDLAALGLGLFAAWAAALPPDEKRTFGYHRIEVLAALGNGVGLWIAVGVLLREAYGRWRQPAPVDAAWMLAVASVGLACNLIAAAMLYKGRRDSLNLRAVFLHVLSDALGSVGAIAAALLMRGGGRRWADPAATVFICAVVSVAAFRLVREAIHILLEGAPSHVDLAAVRRALAGLEGVSDVHDLHLWSLSSAAESLTGHLVVAPGTDPRRTLKAASALLKERFGISHSTLQIEG